MKNIAIITGASSGLGVEFAKQISANYEYDEIWIIARRADRLESLAEQINVNCSQKTNSCVIKAVPMDISGKDGVLRLNEYLKNADRVESTKDATETSSRDISNENGHKICIGLLVNNAGFGTYGPFDETSFEREMDMIDLNCTSLTGICGIAIPYMKKGSVIINTASLAAFLPLGNFAVYGATKAYVLNFSIALAAELKEKGIKVSALCPGSVSTEFANVASNGARKEVKGGIAPDKVVAHCIKRAFKGKKISLYRPKWRFTAFMSRFVGRYLGARYTFKYNKRPHNPDGENTSGKSL